MFLVIDHESRLIDELEKKNITTGPTYPTALNHLDIRNTDFDNIDDCENDVSAFKLLKILLSDWWKSSNTTEHHLKSIRRKVVHMLPKSICSIKIIRIAFRLMTHHIDKIDQRQGELTTSNSICIDPAFQYAMQESIKQFLASECEQKGNSTWLIWSKKDDVLAGYSWYSRKMLVVETLLTLMPLQDVVIERTGKKFLLK